MQYIEKESNEFQAYKELNNHFFGPQSARPLEAFRHHIDVRKGDCILVGPRDLESSIWLGVAKSDTDLDSSYPNHKKVFIQ